MILKDVNTVQHDWWEGKCNLNRFILDCYNWTNAQETDMCLNLRDMTIS